MSFCQHLEAHDNIILNISSVAHSGRSLATCGLGFESCPQEGYFCTFYVTASHAPRITVLQLWFIRGISSHANETLLAEESWKVISMTV
jgi:hypothetical protein